MKKAAKPKRDTEHQPPETVPIMQLRKRSRDNPRANAMKGALSRVLLILRGTCSEFQFVFGQFVQPKEEMFPKTARRHTITLA